VEHDEREQRDPTARYSPPSKESTTRMAIAREPAARAKRKRW
jgi:hypothetical protein